MSYQQEIKRRKEKEGDKVMYYTSSTKWVVRESKDWGRRGEAAKKTVVRAPAEVEVNTLILLWPCGEKEDLYHAGEGSGGTEHSLSITPLARVLPHAATLVAVA